MATDRQHEMASAFLAMHKDPRILILPNVWDVISAKIFEQQGFSAVATTSAGVAAALGYADGQRMSLQENLDVARRIARHVDLPISIDLEAGYATSASGVAESASAVWDAGAVGLNLEDGTGDSPKPLLDMNEMVDRIHAVAEMAFSKNRPIVINARTDVFLAGDANIAERTRTTVERAKAYASAGADCIFVPDVGLLDKSTISVLVREIAAPLNIIAGQHTPPLPELQELGVARVSFGPRPFRATLALLKRISRELLDVGSYGLMTGDTVTYAEVNELLEPGVKGTCGTE